MDLKITITPVTPFSQNCALIWDDASKAGAVIDPGGDVARIMAAIEQNGVDVRDIFLTHGHLDHAGGAAALAAKLEVKITGPGIEDKFLLDSITEQARQYGLEGQNCAPDAWLNEGDEINIGGLVFKVLSCPGHTPGHVVFINHAEKFGILGDVLFNNSVGRTDFLYSNTGALMTAIKTKLLVLPDDFSFICGHGPGSTIGAEKRSNPFIQ